MFKKGLLFIICIGGLIYAEDTQNLNLSSSDLPPVLDFPASTELKKKTNYMTYYSIGTGYFLMLPNVGLGRRYRNQNSTIDISASFSIYLLANGVDVSFNYLHGDKYYFGPGIGLGYAHILGAHKMVGIGKIIGGKNLSDKDFIQLEIAVNNETIDLPFFSIRYGHSF